MLMVALLRDGYACQTECWPECWQYGCFSLEECGGYFAVHAGSVSRPAIFNSLLDDIGECRGIFCLINIL